MVQDCKKTLFYRAKRSRPQSNSVPSVCGCSNMNAKATQNGSRGNYTRRQTSSTASGKPSKNTPMCYLAKAAAAAEKAREGCKPTLQCRTMNIHKLEDRCVGHFVSAWALSLATRRQRKPPEQGVRRVRNTTGSFDRVVTSPSGLLGVISPTNVEPSLDESISFSCFCTVFQVMHAPAPVPFAADIRRRVCGFSILGYRGQPPCSLHMIASTTGLQ